MLVLAHCYMEPGLDVGDCRVEISGSSVGLLMGVAGSSYS